MASASTLIEKATSDLLIGPDWGMNLEICDTINSDPGQAREVVKALKKRLVNKNGNVQLLALTVLESMMKNCGEVVQQSVAEKDILPEMVKIVKKKTDMAVRDKILVLLDSWQEAFGGISGRYPQYYMAYEDLRRCGVEFPERNAENSVPMYTPPPKRSPSSYSYPHGSPRPLPSSYPNANYGSPSLMPISPSTHPHSSFPYPQPPHPFPAPYPNASYGPAPYAATQLENVMAMPAAGEHVWSLKDMDVAQSALDILNEMLNAIEPHDKQGVKDDLISQLLEQCRSSQKSIMHLVNFTSDDQLLGRGLALNDELQRALAKYDAIVSGSQTPSAFTSGSPNNFAVYDQEDSETEHDFSQLARSSRQHRTSATSQESHSLNNAPFALQPPPQPIRRLNPPPDTKRETKDIRRGESLQDASSNGQAPLSSLTNQPSASFGSNPFIDAPSFMVKPPESSPHQANQTPQQYLQELDYSGYVAPWASISPESSSLKPKDVVDSGTQQPHSLGGYFSPQSEALQGTHTSPAHSSHGTKTSFTLPPPPRKHTERELYFQEQTIQTEQDVGNLEHETKNMSNLEQQTKDLSIRKDQYQIAQDISVGNSVQSPSGVVKGAKPSTSADKLFEDLVDFQSMSPNFKKAGMTSSLTRSSKSRASGI